ncbi:hypothetical protein HYFRA_00008261 [Hymenoscyphus fraxineus]|uniref:Uncharacterized protein n=1 Tax=Hymenoscyphus fraxineus TaxID=746836 RepID=A0A9N9L8N5_9HELO|nr:hypothetical protein HYFRA_00008261 [Hymenoscyphus fraxineus]
MHLSTFALLAALLSSADSGPIGYGICQAGCASVVMACYSAAGFVWGATLGVAAPPAILACNSAFGTCQAASSQLSLKPIAMKLQLTATFFGLLFAFTEAKKYRPKPCEEVCGDAYGYKGCYKEYKKLPGVKEQALNFVPCLQGYGVCLDECRTTGATKILVDEILPV